MSFERTPVRDGEVLEIGPRMRVTAVAAPGHTFTHLSYVLDDAATGQRAAVFSGGSLLYGANSTIGREKAANPVLTHDEETCVRELLAGLNAYPAYYAHMAPANSAGEWASIAASFLAAARRGPVAIDDAFGNARLAGLPVTIPDAA